MMNYGQQYSNPYMNTQPNMGYQQPMNGYNGNAYGYSGGYSANMPMVNNQPQSYGGYQAPQSQQMRTSMAYTNGNIEAQAWAVAPGNMVYLFDMDGRTFYTKGVDHNGMPLPFKTYEYTEVVETMPVPTQNYGAQVTVQQPQINLDEYIKRDEVENMIAQEVERRLATMNTATKSGVSKKGADVGA